MTHTVLITGAAVRLGRSIALHLARNGSDIALHYHRSQQEAEALAGEIRALGREAWLLQADLRDAQAISHLFAALAAEKVTPDCLINSAAAFEKDALATLAPESFYLHMATNLLAPLLLMQGFAAQYKGGEGVIINITDGLHGWSMSPAFLSYALSKQGLTYATEMLARELAPRIRVNAVAPGATLPGAQDKPDTFAKLAALSPLGRTSGPEEILAAVDFILVSPSLTGQTIALSGGVDRH